MKITLSIERSLGQPDVDEVLVEGSWFPRADLPRLLGNFMRRQGDHDRQLKQAYMQLEELKRAMTEPKPDTRRVQGPWPEETPA